MKGLFLLIVGLVLGGLVVGLALNPGCASCGGADDSGDGLYQVSTFNALLEGLFDGETTVGYLEEKGDFGIGTFNGLDGEMVVLDGVFYQVRDTGVVSVASPGTGVPFASVVFFQPDDEYLVDGVVNYSVLQSRVDERLPTVNLPYAVKVSGVFEFVKTRAPHMQEKPYPSLVDALANQSVFEYYNVSGTLVGFRLPEYLNGVNVPGYHLHFISGDGSMGGHLLDFAVENPGVEVDYKYDYSIGLPDAAEFNSVELSGDRTEEIEKVEK